MSSPDWTLPDWRTSTAGAMVRVALWLHTEVGPGGAFTKAQLRAAFPDVEQIDRRMRDLRPEGWVIATYREDRSLSGHNELRLVEEGGRVWERGYRSRAGAAITDKQRRDVLASDNYACVYCGVSGGEAYPDDTLRTAKLRVARVSSPLDGVLQLATVCDRCHAGLSSAPAKAPDLLAQADALSAEQRKRLRQWVSLGARLQSPEELLWADYRRAGLEQRLALLQHLAGD